MLLTLRKIFSLFSREEKPRLAGLLLLAIVVALLEVIGVASIMPFMGVLANPELSLRMPALKSVYDALAFTDSRQFMIFLGSASLALIVLSNFLNGLLAWIIIRFAFLKGHALSAQLLGQYVRQPYEFFFSRNITELGKNILAEVDRVVNGVLLPLFQVTAKSFVTILLLIALFVAEPQVALATIGVLGGCYVLIYVLMRYYDPAIKEARLARHVNHPNYTHLRFDLADRKATEHAFAAHKPQGVVNLAAQAGVRYSLENPLAYIHSNIVGFAHVLEGCRYNGVEHLVYASSSSVYGANTTMT